MTSPKLAATDGSAKAREESVAKGAEERKEAGPVDAEAGLETAERARSEAQARVVDLETKLGSRNEAVGAAERQLADIRAARGKLVIAAAEGDRSAAAAAAKQREAVLGAMVDVDDAKAVVAETEARLVDARLALAKADHGVRVARLAPLRLARLACVRQLDAVIAQLVPAMMAYRDAATAHDASLVSAGMRPVGDPDRTLIGALLWQLAKVARQTALPPGARDWFHEHENTDPSIEGHENRYSFEGYERKAAASLAELDSPEAA